MLSDKQRWLFLQRTRVLLPVPTVPAESRGVRSESGASNCKPFNLGFLQEQWSVDVLPAYMSVYSMRTWYCRTEGSTRAATGHHVSCYWESNVGLLEEQSMLSTVENIYNYLF